MAETIIIDAAGEGQRLDVFLTDLLSDFSRSEVQRLIKNGDVTIGGAASKPAYRLESGDTLSYNLPEKPPSVVAAEDIPLEVLYEDADLAAINKPAGLVVHPGHGAESGTLVNAALHRWPQMGSVGGERRYGVVHRLDKDTSGVLVMAKTGPALLNLQRQFAARTVRKRYFALVEGVPASANGLIDAPIGRDPKQRKRMAVIKAGRPAQTRYDLIEAFEEQALLGLDLLTGRTHQIRVHLAWLGHPIVGDKVYGFRKQRLSPGRLFLHAFSLEVDSPGTGERLHFEAPLPADLEAILSKLREKI